MLPRPHLFNQPISHEGASNNHHRSLKRPRLERASSVSDQDEYAQHKSSKRSKRLLPSVAVANTVHQPIKKSFCIINEEKESIKPTLEIPGYFNKTKGVTITHKKTNKRLKIDMSLDNTQNNLTKEVLGRLPNTKFFKSLGSKINNDPDSPLSQTVIEKLDAFHRLNIPYTFLSSLLIKCNCLDPCDALLNKILVKRYNVGYALAANLQKTLNNNIKFNNLSSMLSNSGNQAAELFEQLINTLNEKNVLLKIKALKKVGVSVENLSSILHRSGSQYANQSRYVK